MNQPSKFSWRLLTMLTVGTLFLFGFGCNVNYQVRPMAPNVNGDAVVATMATTTVQVPTSTAPIRTPEHTLEAFIQALEKNDLTKVLSFIAIDSQGTYKHILAGKNLPALAAQLRQSPPKRWDTPHADEETASFLSVVKVNGQAQDEEISLYLENGTWKIVSF